MQSKTAVGTGLQGTLRLRVALVRPRMYTRSILTGRRPVRTLSPSPSLVMVLTSDLPRFVCDSWGFLVFSGRRRLGIIA